MINQHPDPEIVDCVCCLGPPDLVCAACGEHSCWAGYFFCENYLAAGVITKTEFESRGRQEAS